MKAIYCFRRLLTYCMDTSCLCVCVLLFPSSKGHLIRAYLDTILVTLTKPIVSGLMHLPIIPISINYQDRFLACQYLSAPVFFKIFLTSLHHNETLKAKKKGIFKNDLLFCKNECLAHGIQQPIPKLHFFFIWSNCKCQIQAEETMTKLLC